MSAALEAALEFLDRHAGLRRTLHGVQQCLEQIDSFVSVGSFALRAQAADIDCGVAAVLDAAASAVQRARESLVMATQDSAEKLDLRSSLAAVRDKLRQFNASGQGGEQLSVGEDVAQPSHVLTNSQTLTHEELRQIINREYRSMQRMEALMIAVRFAVDHEGDGLDPADAVDGILQLLRQSLERIDRWEVAS